MSFTKHRFLMVKLILAIGVIYLVLDVGGRVLHSCNLNAELLKPSTNWKISSSTLSAEILWQKAEPRLRSTSNILSPWTSLVLSSDNILYWQSSGTENCDTNPVVAAYDLLTGREQWRFRPDAIDPKLFSTAKGYLLVNAFSMVMLDFQGVKLWEYHTNETNLPLRSILRVYEGRDSVYIPTNPGLYRVSLQTGELLETKDSGNVLGVFEDLALFKTDANTAQLASLADPQKSVYSLQFPDSRFVNFPLNPLFPYVELRNDILFLYFLDYNTSTIEAYQFDTGERIWKLEEPFYGFPVIFEDSGTLVLYSPNNTLEVREMVTGNLLGEVKLEQSIKSANVAINPTTSYPDFSVAIAGYNDTVFVRRGDTLELIAVRLDFPQ